MKKIKKCFLRIVFPSVSVISLGIWLSNPQSNPAIVHLTPYQKALRPSRADSWAPHPEFWTPVHLDGIQNLPVKQASRWCWYIQYRNHSLRTTSPTVVNPGSSLQLPRTEALWKVRWLDSYKETVLTWTVTGDCLELESELYLCWFWRAWFWSAASRLPPAQCFVILGLHSDHLSGSVP